MKDMDILDDMGLSKLSAKVFQQNQAAVYQSHLKHKCAKVKCVGLVVITNPTFLHIS